MAETLREVFSEAAVAARVAELGREVSARYAGTDRDVVMGLPASIQALSSSVETSP